MALALLLAGTTLLARTSTVSLRRLAMAPLLLLLALEMRRALLLAARMTVLLSMLGFDLWMLISQMRLSPMILEPFSGISSF
jgi:hypothetical protein